MSIRNPEELPATVWELANLRPISDAEYENRSYQDEWLTWFRSGWERVDDNTEDVSRCGHRWTICVPKDLPMNIAPKPHAFTVARLQEILDAGTHSPGPRRSIQSFIDQLKNHTP